MLQQKSCSGNVEIPGGEGGHQSPPWNGNSEVVGGGANQKPSVGGVWIFSGTTH